MRSLLTAITLTALFAAPALAQGHTAHMGGIVDLPAICQAGAGTPAMGMSMGMAAPSGDRAHQDLMSGMDQMNTEMMAGGTAADIDVAFICAMIPHHRGAIAMAKAELAHGDDPWARELAQAIITAQEKEIADMLAWLDTQPKP